MSRCFDHIDLRVPSLAAARPFYSRLLPALGFTREVDVEGWLQWETPDASEFFGMTADPSHQVNRTRVASSASARGEVDRLAHIAVDAGAREMEGPMDYETDYYAAFFEDPFGNRLEICCRK